MTTNLFSKEDRTNKMQATIRRMIDSFFRSRSLALVRVSPDGFPVDFRDEEKEIVREVSPWTMTSSERVYALIQAVKYISSSEVPGAIVECGVWKGGGMAAAARILLREQDPERELYLFDTFEGMCEPTPPDRDRKGKQASDILREMPSSRCDDAPLESVKKVLYDTGYPKAKIHFVQGRVETTIPDRAPDSISLLRLDTDWYESTKHELIHLFPRLSPRGVIIIDDYGHWLGCRQACDEYFTQNRIPILLNRIDYTGRIALKV